MKVLITTTSFIDTPGPHHDLLKAQGWEVVTARGPLSEEDIFNLVGDFDAIICGDDAYTPRVLEKALPKLRVLSKYGIGLDKIDLVKAKELGIPVLFTPGVNHTTVAEHTFLLMLGLAKRVNEHANWVREGKWKRQTGNELANKTLGLVGLGRIGQETAKRAAAFDMKVLGYGNYWDEEVAAKYGIERCLDLDDLLRRSDIVSLHTKLTAATRGVIGEHALSIMKDGAFLVNCGRGELVDTPALLTALERGKLAGYGADVLDEEPPRPDHPLLKAPNTLITPHIGSRTYESVARQAGMAVENTILFLSGGTPHGRAV
jgi:D-3-phosphoglycerate dehydrogenase